MFNIAISNDFCLQNKDILVKTKICFLYNHSKEKSSPEDQEIALFVSQSRKNKTQNQTLMNY